MTEPTRKSSVIVRSDSYQGRGWYRVETRDGGVLLGYVHRAYPHQVGEWRAAMPRQLLNEAFNTRAEAVRSLVAVACGSVVRATA